MIKLSNILQIITIFIFFSCNEKSYKRDFSKNYTEFNSYIFSGIDDKSIADSIAKRIKTVNKDISDLKKSIADGKQGIKNLENSQKNKKNVNYSNQIEGLTIGLKALAILGKSHEFHLKSLKLHSKISNNNLLLKTIESYKTYYYLFISANKAGISANQYAIRGYSQLLKKNKNYLIQIQSMPKSRQQKGNELRLKSIINNYKKYIEINNHRIRQFSLLIKQNQQMLQNLDKLEKAL